MSTPRVVTTFKRPFEKCSYVANPDAPSDALIAYVADARRRGRIAWTITAAFGSVGAALGYAAIIYAVIYDKVSPLISAILTVISIGTMVAIVLGLLASGLAQFVVRAACGEVMPTDKALLRYAWYDTSWLQDDAARDGFGSVAHRNLWTASELGADSMALDEKILNWEVARVVDDEVIAQARARRDALARQRAALLENTAEIARAGNERKIATEQAREFLATLH